LVVGTTETPRLTTVDKGKARQDIDLGHKGYEEDKSFVRHDQPEPERRATWIERKEGYSKKGYP
jgi:hypothetical protein